MSAELDDLTVTKLCGQALGFDLIVEDGSLVWDSDMPQWYADKVGREPHDVECWDPLHDDAQCMALVKVFPGDCLLACLAHLFACRPNTTMALSFDLNRCICLCVARMQLAKESHDSN